MIDETNVDEHGRTKNIPPSYQAKQKEFITFCDIVYAGTKMEKQYTINPDKVKQFVLHIAFREQKKRGRRKKGKDLVIFDLAEWNRITTLFVENSQNVVKNR